MTKNRGLGRGLDAIFSDVASGDSSKESVDASLVSIVRLSDIEPDKNQPRKTFDAEALSALADSISRHGILQPIVVRKPEEQDNGDTVSKILGNKYKIVAGERRWRAAKMAGLTEAPVIIKDLTDHEAAAIMLVENLQREDLNAVEQARGFERLLYEFELTQEQTAAIVGISRPALTNSLRLLTLPKYTLTLLENGDISAGHARALLAISDGEEIDKAAKSVAEKGLSVRETERLAKLISEEKSKGEEAEKSINLSKEQLSLNAYIGTLSEKVSSSLGRKAKILSGKKGTSRGKLELEYYSREDLEKLLTKLCGKDIFSEEE